MKKYFTFLISLLLSLPAYATTSTINPTVPAANSPLSSAVVRNNFGAAYNDVNALWAALHSATGVTWPTSGDVVISNGTNAPAGVAEIDGDCLKGVSGVWATGACGSGGSGLVVGTTTITSGTNGDVEYNNNGVLGELSSVTTVNSQSCALGGSCTVAAAAGTLTGTTLNSTVVSSSLTSLGTIATGVWHGTKVGLAYGGTNADLSATGGTSEVLKQVSSGAAVTVAQLACSDLSNAAASCSTDATDASNISSGLLASTLGGTGVDNTATLTLGSSNQNWATLGTGIVKNTTTTGALSDAASSDIIALFSTCSGTQYLGADGSCHNASGSGVSSFTGDGTILSNSGSTGAVTASLENAGAGTVLGNASSSATTPSYSSTPQLGKSGTLGSIAMGNATSGLLTLEPATGALGTVTVSIPAATDTLVNLAGTQTLTNKTITFSGNTLTGVAPLASPTFSGTVTAPDSSTWTSSGIGSLAALGVGETAPAAGIINVSSKYEVGGSQISCSSLSNGATGCSTATGTSGATIPLLNGNNTASGNNIQSGTYAITGTSLPAQAGGTFGLAGTASAPTLGANSEGDIWLTATGGINLIGQGSTNDFSLFNKGGASVCTVATGTTNFNCTGLQVGGTSVLTANQTITMTGDATGSGTTAITVNVPELHGNTLTNTDWCTSNGTIINCTSAIPVTTFSAGTTGLTPNSATTGAVTLAGTLAIANGGTGQTTANPAFNALSPMTTGGDLIYGGASGAGTRLANGGAGQVLKSQGTTLAPVWAANSLGGGMFMYSDNGVTLTANTYFVPIGGGGIPSTTEASVDNGSPSATTIANLFVGVSAAPGAGNSYTITLRDGGADQAVTCQISGASAVSCSDTTHSFNVAQGDLIDWKVVSAGTIVTTPTLTILSNNGTSSVGVTSIATNNGVTGGTITTTGTVGLASVSNNNVLCNNSGSSAVPTAANCAVTGTGNAVLAASPTLSGTATTANITGVGNDYLSGGYIETGAAFTANTSTSYALNIDNGPKQVITITGAVALTLATPTHAGSATFKLLEDGTGHIYSITGCKWAGGTAITYSTAAAAYDIVSVWYDGTNSNCMGGAGFN